MRNHLHFTNAKEKYSAIPTLIDLVVDVKPNRNGSVADEEPQPSSSPWHQQLCPPARLIRRKHMVLYNLSHHSLGTRVGMHISITQACLRNMGIGLRGQSA